jgi:hypothetical protein
MGLTDSSYAKVFVGTLAQFGGVTSAFSGLKNGTAPNGVLAVVATTADNASSTCGVAADSLHAKAYVALMSGSTYKQILYLAGNGFCLASDQSVLFSSTTSALGAADAAIGRSGAATLGIQVNSTLDLRASFSQTNNDNDTSLILYSRDAGTWTAHRVVRNAGTGVLSMP